MAFPAPHLIAAALFEACAQETLGDKPEAARMAALLLFDELCERLGPGQARLDQLLYEPDSDENRRERRSGINRARRVFRRHATSPAQAQINERRNWQLLDRFDEAGGSILAFAKKLAQENQTLPLKERRAAGGVDVHALEKHIRDVVRKRQRGLEAGNWFGPVTEAQAVRYQGATIRHSGAKKVETSS